MYIRIYIYVYIVGQTSHGHALDDAVQCLGGAAPPERVVCVREHRQHLGGGCFLSARYRLGS